jgi:pimeloyl-ACP methyl ester carboxylesterase
MGDKTVSSRSVTVNGLKIDYLAAGTGQPVVLLHGWPTSSYLWRNLIPVIAKNHRVIAPDLPGFGGSDKPLDETYSLDFYDGVLTGFLDQLELERVSLVVHDLGGPIGLVWAIRRPERLERLVVLDTIAYPDLPLRMRLGLKLLRVPLVKNWIAGPSGIAFTMRVATANKRALTREVIRQYQKPFRRTAARQVLLKTMTDLDLAGLREIAEGLKSLDVPALIVWGRKDPALTLSIARRLQADLPRSELIVLDKSSHFLQEDEPEKVAELIRQFCSRAAQSTT